jgi:hypothetical protein
MRNRAVLISSLIVAALVAALLAGEFYARHTAKKCMSEQFRNDLGTNVDIGFSAKPMLLQLIDSKVPYVTVDSDDTAFGPAQQMKVHARVNDVDIEQTSQNAGTIGSSSADISWPTEGIDATLQKEIGGLVNGVTADDSAGTLNFSVLSGLATVKVKPQIVGDKVEVKTVEAKVIGLGVPSDLVDGIVNAISSSLQQYPLGMTPKSLEITDKGLEMRLEGGKFTLPLAEQGQKVDGCGVLS